MLRRGIPVMLANQTWRIILDIDRDPAMNMALDTAILESVIAGDVPPTLRFYGWTRPAVTVGFHQKPEVVLNLKAVERAGIEVVIRPTGGRAVLHGDDLTYSIAIPATEVRGSGVTASYRFLSEALAEGLAEGGIDVTLARGRGSSFGPGPQPCFSSTSRYELVHQGRKLVGSAQRRMKGGLLQQGSIPLRSGAFMIWDLLPASVLKSSEQSGWTTVEEAVGRSIAAQTLARHIGVGFCRYIGAMMISGMPSDQEIVSAKKQMSQE